MSESRISVHSLTDTNGKGAPALNVFRYSAGDRSHPLTTVSYENRVTVLKKPNGEVVFDNTEDYGFRVPTSWSILSGDIAAEKYGAKAGCSVLPDGRESGVDEVVHRVVQKITTHGLQNGYFISPENSVNFQRELEHLLINQYGAFNSPVWFNVGLDLYGRTGSGGNYYWNQHDRDGDENGAAVKTEDAYTRPQSSACFILKRTDDLDSIYQGVKDEARLFKYGSGAGSNFSPIRSKYEFLSGGGTSSGLMSFLKVYDAAAGSLKSGGTTRRAAKMVVLNDTHPEIMDFVKWKSGEEKKAKILEANGYSGGMEGEALLTVSGQNSNNSVCFSDEFMSVIAPGSSRKLWSTRLVTTGVIHQTFPAADLWRAVAVNTWECGDPGVHFGGTINAWHTCPNSGPINASNPCCLTRDMRVDTSEGRISIERLCEMYDRGETLPLVFAYDRDERLPVLRPIKRVWVAGKTARVVEVVTQRGLKLRCTPEHRFLLHDGTYVEAQNLVSGMRLRKIARTVNDQRSDRKSIMHRITPKADNGCEYQNRWMWEQVNGPIPEGYEVHHLNEDPTDDRLSNFALRTITEHRQEHGTGEENPRYIDAAEALLLETWEAVARMNNGRPSKIGQVTVARWNRYVRENGLQGQVPVAKNTDRAIRGMSWDQFSTWIGERQLAANDRVAYVRPVQYVREVPVYDLEVEGVHNFAITDATSSQEHTIVVHNSEYLFLDDTACNLASLNLLKYIKYTNGPKTNGEMSVPSFDIELFQHHCRLLFIAQEILVGLSSYPTPKVAENSYKYRPLGLGHCNGGMMLMTLGIPYDSEEGRALMGAITSLMTGTAYHTSTMLAQVKGPFEGYEANKEPFLKVMEKHRQAHWNLPTPYSVNPNLLSDISNAGCDAWDAVIKDGALYGFRNAQATVLAPTGTIGFLMGAETTGIEPLYSIVMTKKYAGGSYRKIVCEGALAALSALPDVYDPDVVLKNIIENGHVEGSGLPEKYWPIFATAGGQANVIPWKAHVEMMAACQPFLSGAISKTVNMPQESTVEDIEAAYLMSYQKGIKAVAIYRDGSKSTQPLNTEKKSPILPDSISDTPAEIRVTSSSLPSRDRMADKAVSDTYRPTLGGQRFYLHVGLSDSGKPLEVFVRGLKMGGSTLALIDAWCIAVSCALQYGMPLSEVVDKFTFLKFEPAGGVQHHSSIRMCSSIIDLIARILGYEYLGMKDLGHVDLEETPNLYPMKEEAESARLASETQVVRNILSAAGKAHNAPLCDNCGHLTQPNGKCYRCPNCGHSMGCS